VTPSQRIAIAAQLERADAWLQALKQPNLASLADAAGTKQRDAGQYEDIVLELAFELRWSEYMAGDRMQCAAELRRLPLTWLALAQGQISYVQARTIALGSGLLQSGEDSAELDRRMRDRL